MWFRDVDAGQVKFGVIEVKLARFGDAGGVVVNFGRIIGQRLGHFVGAFQPQVHVPERLQFLVGNLPLPAHQLQQPMGIGLIGIQVMAVIGADQRQPQFGGDLDQRGVGIFLLLRIVMLDLQIKSAVEYLSQPSGGLPGGAGIARC